MKIPLLELKNSKTMVAMLALAIGAGNLHAITYTLAATAPTIVAPATVPTMTVNCSTTTGPASGTITLKPTTALSGASTIVVALWNPLPLTNGIVVTAPSVQTLGATASISQSLTVSYTVTFAAGCGGVSATTPGTPLHLFFSAGGTKDIPVDVIVTLDASKSGLIVSPPAVNVSCIGNSGTAVSQIVNVTSAAAANLGTPFNLTANSVSTNLPGWLTIKKGTAAGADADSTTQALVAQTISFAFVPVCAGLTVGMNKTFNVYLHNDPMSSDMKVVVTLQVVTANPLTPPDPVSISYTKNSGNPGYADVKITSTVPGLVFTVDTTSLQPWINVDSTYGSVGKTLRFSTTSAADSLPPGNYSDVIKLNVQGYSTKTFTINLLLNNPTPLLSVQGGTTQFSSPPTPWLIGSTNPTASITLISTDAPIAFSLSGSGALSPLFGPNAQATENGLAYSFGTTIAVSFSPTAFSAALPGSTLTGAVNITWGTPPTTTVVPFSFIVTSPAPTILSLSPGSLPTAAAGKQFTVTIVGTGFIVANGSQKATTVGILSGANVSQIGGIVANVLNPSNIALTITTGDTTNLPAFGLAQGGTVKLGICNGSACPTAQATYTLNVSPGPVVQSVTSASTFIQPSGTVNVAPFDLISIFGTNFCTSGASGCTSVEVIPGTLDPTYKFYNTSLMVPEDSAVVAAKQRYTSVTFTPAAGGAAVFAPLLFASNNQINAVVPSGLSGAQNVQVNFGYGTTIAAGITAGTMFSSNNFSVTIVPTNPGIFTVSAAGQGDGAILDSNWALISKTNPAGMRYTNTNSDSIEIFMTGLGVPDTTNLATNFNGTNTRLSGRLLAAP